MVLTISMLYRGCTIPVAWATVLADPRGSWLSVWERLLALPVDVSRRIMVAFVLADRGLYAKRFFQTIVSPGWYPLLCITSGGSLRPACSQQKPAPESL